MLRGCFVEGGGGGGGGGGGTACCTLRRIASAEIHPCGRHLPLPGTWASGVIVIDCRRKLCRLPLPHIEEGTLAFAFEARGAEEMHI